MQTNRLGARPLVQGNGGPGWFEVFDGLTGELEVAGPRRAEGEHDARSRGGDSSEPASITLQFGPEEISALRRAVEAFLAFQIAGEAHRILEELYVLSASWGRWDSG